MTEPRTYRKTATVQAMQWDGSGDSTRAIIKWADGKITKRMDGPAIRGLIVHTLEGPLGMNVGDWALMGDEGEFWPNRGDIFARSYEQVEATVEKYTDEARAHAWDEGVGAAHHSPLTLFAIKQVNPYRAEETR